MSSITAITDFVVAEAQARVTSRALAAVAEISPSAAQPLIEGIGDSFDDLEQAARNLSPTLDGTGSLVDYSV